MSLNNYQSLFFFFVDFIIIIMLFFTILLILCYNPLHASLFLVFLFFLSGFLLMLVNASFLGFIFIIVYAGAIAVLFIFIVMMLNLRRLSLFNLYPLKERSILFLKYYDDRGEENFTFLQLILLFFFLIFFFFFGKIILMYYLPFYHKSFNLYTNIELSITNMLAYYLYDQYMFIILISGLLLLVAMLGAILITDPYRYNLVREKDFEQINKKVTNVVLLYKRK